MFINGLQCRAGTQAISPCDSMHAVADKCQTCDIGVVRVCTKDVSIHWLCLYVFSRCSRCVKTSEGKLVCSSFTMTPDTLTQVAFRQWMTFAANANALFRYALSGVQHVKIASSDSV